MSDCEDKSAFPHVVAIEPQLPSLNVDIRGHVLDSSPMFSHSCASNPKPTSYRPFLVTLLQAPVDNAEHVPVYPLYGLLANEARVNCPDMLRLSCNMLTKTKQVEVWGMGQ